MWDSTEATSGAVRVRDNVHDATKPPLARLADFSEPLVSGRVVSHGTVSTGLLT